jgi:hypothetical protein
LTPYIIALLEHQWLWEAVTSGVHDTFSGINYIRESCGGNCYGHEF